MPLPSSPGGSAPRQGGEVHERSGDRGEEIGASPLPPTESATRPPDESLVAGPAEQEAGDEDAASRSGRPASRTPGGGEPLAELALVAGERGRQGREPDAERDHGMPGHREAAAPPRPVADASRPRAPASAPGRSGGGRRSPRQPHWRRRSRPRLHPQPAPSWRRPGSRRGARRTRCRPARARVRTARPGFAAGAGAPRPGRSRPSRGDQTLKETAPRAGDAELEAEDAAVRMIASALIAVRVEEAEAGPRPAPRL